MASSVKPIKSKREQSVKRKRGVSEDEEDDRGGKQTGARNETERRMYAAVRNAGRATKSGGTMGEFGGLKRSEKGVAVGGAGGEFQVLDAADIRTVVGMR